MTNGIAMGSLPLAATEAAPNPKNAADAARQFEALLIAQLLRTARESGAGDGWLGTGSDPTADSALQLAEEQFAAAMSAQGGLGLARMIEAGLAQSEAETGAK